MKRSPVSLEEVAGWDNLMHAAYRAARGKRRRAAVEAFFTNLDDELMTLQAEILSGRVPVGQCRRFYVFDPKCREIIAPAFRERVLHHALMSVIGPVLDRGLVDDSFACRVGKGSLAAVHRVQHHARRFSWFGKLDVRKYFASIDHRLLMSALERRFKNERLLALVWRIIDAHHETTGRGLPIGALTSQNFANFFLSPFDRWLLDQPQVHGIVRYMDDVLWWCDCRKDAIAIASRAEEFLATRLSLTIRSPTIVNRSERGVTCCGFRIFPGIIKLTRRRKERYRAARNRWERRFHRGEESALCLQAGYASALAMTTPAHSVAWRRRELELHPSAEV